MQDASIVIVLGAGASKAYGLPLGFELTQQAVAFLEENQLFETNEWNEGVHDANGFADIARRLRRSRTPTIDHYIGQNGAAADKLKAAIAGVIWEAEADALDPSTLPEDDWISWLYHRALKRRPQEFPSNRIQFISFNYDRLPQAIIATMMANTFENTKAEDALKIITTTKGWESSPLPRFVHVHGDLNAPLIHYRPDYNSDVDYHRLCNREPGRKRHQNQWSMLASKIATVHESDSKDATKLANSIRTCMYNANKVVFIGFGFHQLNLSRIGLDSQTIERLQKMGVDMCGTGIKLAGVERNRVQKIMGANFRLGPEDDTCVQFFEREFST